MTERKLDEELALQDAARRYHRQGQRGKISVVPTKPLATQRDLALAYSPGVAYPCLDIQRDPSLAADYTARGNLVGVITNGTAVLGLGDIGPLASKPVMEGKGCLFKKFAGIDVFDIELAERDPDRLIDIIAAMEPTLGGINLEDIKAPECFYIERALAERLSIPVFHDDQHGTAIISAAALVNALEVVDKLIGEVRIAVSGAGAAAIACLDLIVALGADPAKIHVCDSKGVIYAGRPGLDESKVRFAQATAARHLSEVVSGADIFLGCSSAGVLTGEMVKTMAARPIILALANPEPEIRPEVAKLARPDCIIATGRSDYPNQVNNVLCFPYIFRGALDVGATRITAAMKLACVREIAALAKEAVTEEVAAAYPGQDLRFGPGYLIPTPFDARLLMRLAPAVALAACLDGVATRPIADLPSYRASLAKFRSPTADLLGPLAAAARASGRCRLVLAEGEDERTLRAAQILVDEGLARPILVGRAEAVRACIETAGLRLQAGLDFELLDPESDARLDRYSGRYHSLLGPDDVPPSAAYQAVRHSNSLTGALALEQGDADAMICGTVGQFDRHLTHVRQVFAARPSESTVATLHAVVQPAGTLFIADTFVNVDPDADTLARIAVSAVAELRRFGVEPCVAFLANCTFAAVFRGDSEKMQRASKRFRELEPDVKCVDELHILPGRDAAGGNNLLICPTLDTANVLINVLELSAGQASVVGPLLLGIPAPVHVLAPTASVQRIVDMAIVAVSSCVHS